MNNTKGSAILNIELENILEISSSNLYTGIDVNDTSDMQRKSELVKNISRLINTKQISPSDIPSALGIDLAQWLRIKRGQFREIEETQLIDILEKLK